MPKQTNENNQTNSKIKFKNQPEKLFSDFQKKRLNSYFGFLKEGNLEFG